MGLTPMRASENGVVRADWKGGDPAVRDRTLQGRRVRCIATDGTAVLVGSTDGMARSDDGGATWHAADDGLDGPWPEHMVERFLTVGEQLVAVLSNGHVIALPRDRLRWRRILPEVEDAAAAAVSGAPGNTS